MFGLPDDPPLIAVAASGATSAKIAAELGDGLFVTEPKPGIVQHYRRRAEGAYVRGGAPGLGAE